MPNLTGLDTLILRTVTSCIIHTVSLFFSGIQTRRAGTAPISSRRLVEGSMRLFFKKPAITSPTSPISSLRALATRTSPSCSTKTPSPTLWFSPSRKAPQAKVRGARSYSSFVGFRVFSTWQLVSVGIWWVGRAESFEHFVSHYAKTSKKKSGVWIHMAATSMITQHLALDLVTKPLTFLCFYIFAPLTYLAPTASSAVNMRNKEGLSADITNTTVCGDDVHDRDVAHQSHVSAHLFPSSPITCESLGASCFAPH